MLFHRAIFRFTPWHSTVPEYLGFALQNIPHLSINLFGDRIYGSSEYRLHRPQRGFGETLFEDYIGNQLWDDLVIQESIRKNNVEI